MKASEAKDIYIKHFEYGCNVCEDACQDELFEQCTLADEKIQEALDLLEKQEADGCVGCKYIGKDKYEMPCLRCKRNMQDLWKAEKRLEELKNEK